MSDLISRAERFARVRHEGQFRKGKDQEPYTNHLVEVAALVDRWSDSEPSNVSFDLSSVLYQNNALQKYVESQVNIRS